MPASPAIRTSRVKDDDQIAFENGTSFEEANSYTKALDCEAEEQRRESRELSLPNCLAVEKRLMSYPTRNFEKPII